MEGSMDVIEMCAHRGCRCDAREDGFCSDHCAAHAGSGGSEQACECGHADCAAGPAAECAWG
jgi:hypothetical protein